MKTLNYVKILLLCVFTIGLASCGDDVYYTMQNSDDKLCGKTWIEEYQTENKDGVEVLCSHQLKFAKADNSGQEIWEYYRGGESRPYETTSRTFTWKWMVKSMEGLTLNYGAGEIKYFDNVWVREHYLSGKLDGVVVMMVDANYK